MSPGAAGQSEGTLMGTWGELCQQIAWVTVTKQEGHGIDGAAAEMLLQCERERRFYTQGNPGQTLRVLLKQSQKA